MRIEYVQGIKTNAGDEMEPVSKNITVDKTQPVQEKFEQRGNTAVLTFSEALASKNMLPCSFEVKVNGKSLVPAKTRITVEGNKIKIDIEGLDIKADDDVQVTYSPQHKTWEAYITDESGNQARPFTVEK